MEIQKAIFFELIQKSGGFVQRTIIFLPGT